MKKNIQRIISAVLALILSVGALPVISAFALADDAVPEDQASGGLTDASISDDIGNFVEGASVAGYKYSPRDNYFYVDQNKAWQGRFGYMRAYDIIAPYVLLEYDYIRIHFTYEEKDWMIQLWKGQYGAVFYGCEAGIYNKEASGKEDTAATVYQPVSGSDRPYMQTTMYHDPLHIGKYDRELTTPYEQTWWSTGFKMGHLTVEEPANELRQTGVITFKDEKLAQFFVDGLSDCGFTAASGSENMNIDTYYRDGTSVYYNWQNISEAENTMGIKVAVGTMLFMHFAAFMTVILIVVGAMMSMGMLMLII